MLYLCTANGPIRFPPGLSNVWPWPFGGNVLWAMSIRRWIHAKAVAVDVAIISSWPAEERCKSSRFHAPCSRSGSHCLHCTKHAYMHMPTCWTRTVLGRPGMRLMLVTYRSTYLPLQISSCKFTILHRPCNTGRPGAVGTAARYVALCI